MTTFQQGTNNGRPLEWSMSPYVHITSSTVGTACLLHTEHTSTYEYKTYR